MSSVMFHAIAHLQGLFAYKTGFGMETLCPEMKQQRIAPHFGILKRSQLPCFPTIVKWTGKRRFGTAQCMQALAQAIVARTLIMSNQGLSGMLRCKGAQGRQDALASKKQVSAFRLASIKWTLDCCCQFKSHFGWQCALDTQSWACFFGLFGICSGRHAKQQTSHAPSAQSMSACSKLDLYSLPVTNRACPVDCCWFCYCTIAC